MLINAVKLMMNSCGNIPVVGQNVSRLLWKKTDTSQYFRFHVTGKTAYMWSLGQHCMECRHLWHTQAYSILALLSSWHRWYMLNQIRQIESKKAPLNNRKEQCLGKPLRDLWMSVLILFLCILTVHVHSHVTPCMSMLAKQQSQQW